MAEKQPVIIIKRKAAGGHGHHGGAWKVAYADFVTAMMAFFLVMWLLGADEEVKSAIAQYFNHPVPPWQVERSKQDTLPIGEKSMPGASILNGLDGQNPDDAIRAMNRPSAATIELGEIAKLVQKISEGRIPDIDGKIENLEFSVPEKLLFKPGTNQIAPEAEKFFDKIGKALKPYDGVLYVKTEIGGAEGGNFDSYESAMERSVNLSDQLVKRRYIDESRMHPAVGKERAEADRPRKIFFQFAKSKKP